MSTGIASDLRRAIGSRIVGNYRKPREGYTPYFMGLLWEVDEPSQGDFWLKVLDDDGAQTPFWIALADIATLSVDYPKEGEHVWVPGDGGSR